MLEEMNLMIGTNGYLDNKHTHTHTHEPVFVVSLTHEPAPFSSSPFFSQATYLHGCHRLCRGCDAFGPGGLFRQLRGTGRVKVPRDFGRVEKLRSVQYVDPKAKEGRACVRPFWVFRNSRGRRRPSPRSAQHGISENVENAAGAERPGRGQRFRFCASR